MKDLYCSESQRDSTGCGLIFVKLRAITLARLAQVAGPKMLEMGYSNLPLPASCPGLSMHDSLTPLATTRTCLYLLAVVKGRERESFSTVVGFRYCKKGPPTVRLI